MASEEQLRDLASVEVRSVVDPVTATAEKAAKAWLNECQLRRTAVCVGQVFSAGGVEFGVVTCTPRRRGAVTSLTEISVSASPVPLLSRVQLACLDARGSACDESSLYQEHIRPLLLRARTERKIAGGRYLLALVQDQVLLGPDVEFGVRAMDPPGRYGAVDETTEFYVNQEETAVFSKVHILPYEDTLPCAYRYDLFRDFLQPFLQAHPFATYGEGDHFTYGGVRFRLMATDPSNVVARVGSQTVVYDEGEPLRPTVLDLMPPELRQDLQRLPRGLQMLLLNTMANEEAVRGQFMEVQQVMRRGGGLAASDIRSCGKTVRWVAADRLSDTQQTCMVCLSEFQDGEELRELSCSHLFHVGCIGEWLQRSASCPICKQPCNAGSGSAASSSDRGIEEGANLLQNARIIYKGESGTILGFDDERHLFKIRLDNNTSGIAAPAIMRAKPEELVQSLSGVRLIGLQSEEFNGLTGQIVGLDIAKSRYQVRLSQDRVLGVKFEHCVLPEGAIARVIGLREDGANACWNGHYGRVVGFNEPRMRHVLAMQPRGQLLSVRPKNLRV